jgi:hypothetical protein
MHEEAMSFNPPFLSFRRIKWVWRNYMAMRSERLENVEAGLRHLEEASALGPLPLTGQVIRAQLLLQGKREAAAQAALNAIIADPVEIRHAAGQLYLKAYCESLLESIERRTCMAQLGKVAPDIPGVAFLWRDRFPIPDCKYCDIIKSL